MPTLARVSEMSSTMPMTETTSRSTSRCMVTGPSSKLITCMSGSVGPPLPRRTGRPQRALPRSPAIRNTRPPLMAPWVRTPWQENVRLVHGNVSKADVRGAITSALIAELVACHATRTTASVGRGQLAGEGKYLTSGFNPGQCASQWTASRSRRRQERHGPLPNVKLRPRRIRMPMVSVAVRFIRHQSGRFKCARR